MNELEACFDLNELFFSKTDRKGLIQSCNQVFVRVSEYTEEQLLQRPHNVIRHRDTPRAIFKLFWSYLNENRPIAAYVKNKSKTGRYYWVFAMTFPMKDGFLSVRLKPSSSMFPNIQALYERLLNNEHQGQSMEQSIAILLETLKEMGFSSYEDFMAQALLSELHTRDEQLRNNEQNKPAFANHINLNVNFRSLLGTSDIFTRSIRTFFSQTNALYDKSTNLQKESKGISRNCEAVKFVTTNLTIASAKLGDIGKPLGVVSTNLLSLTSDIAKSALKFDEVFGHTQLAIQDMRLAIGISRFQIEMMNQLIFEEFANRAGEQANADQEAKFYGNCVLLKELIENNIRTVGTTFNLMNRSTQSLLESILDLSKVIAGMEVVRIVGRIEMARLQSSEGLLSRLHEMDQLTDLFRKTLKLLEDESKRILNICTNLESDIATITTRLQSIGEIISTNNENRHF